MACDITKQWMWKQIAYSNQQAAKNRNFYPIQEQATQMDLWEYVPCNCDENCTCRKHGCTHHWKLKSGIRFEEFRDGFLRMFVDSNHHHWVIAFLNGKRQEGINMRALGALRVLLKLKESWQDISEKASEHNKTLFCDDWLPASFHDSMSFPVGTSIYFAKRYCVLFPDIGVPYDTASRIIMSEHLDLRDVNYVEFLTRVREAFLKCMNEHALTIPALRRLDDPQGQLPFDPSLISLPHGGMDYGTIYTPAERTISIVLDKCFYQPKTGSNPSPRNRNKPKRQREIPEFSFTTLPLSGKGQTIMVQREPPLWQIWWGDLKFELTNKMLRTILEKFFIEPGRWYLLGASMTEPDPDGLGSFVRKEFPSFSPRHASAIAAILVHDDFVLSRGRKPIELRKTDDCKKKINLTLGEEND